MKYFFLVLYFYMTILTLSRSNSVNKFNLKSNSNLNENCSGSCLSCQNTLYFLKFRGNAECRFNMCPGLCMSISGQWNSNRNTHLNFFKEDKINICETCFRSNHCHINDCILEKTIVHHAIEHATNKFNYHYLNPNSGAFNMINKKAEDYYFNMDFIFKNLEKTISQLNQYEHTYSDSIKLKRLYKIVLKSLAQKSNLKLSDINLGLDIDIDDDIFSKWKDILEHIRIYKNYYISLKSDKIHLNEEKIYLSTDIKKEEENIKNIIDFDTKVKYNLEKAHNITELYRIKFHSNLDTLQKLVTYVDVLNCNNIDNHMKMEILTGKLKYTDQELDILLKTPPPKQQSITSIKSNTIPSIQVAGRTISIHKDDNKNSNMLPNNTLSNPNTKILPFPHRDIINQKSLDEDDDLVDEIGDTLKPESNKKEIPVQKGAKQTLVENRIKEPSLTGTSKVITKDTTLLNHHQIEDNNKVNLNYNKIKETSIQINNASKNPTLFNKIVSNNSRVNTNNINQVNIALNTNKLSTANINNEKIAVVSPKELIVKNTLPLAGGNLLVKNTTPSQPALQGALLVKSTIPLPHPPVTGSLLVKSTMTGPHPPIPNSLVVKSTIPSPHPIVPNSLIVKSTVVGPLPPVSNNLLVKSTMPLPLHPTSEAVVKSTMPVPPLIPMATKITAVKLTSPNNTYNKNVFKPHAKIDTMAKLILGIDPRPKINNQNAEHILVAAHSDMKHTFNNNSTTNTSEVHAHQDEPKNENNPEVHNNENHQKEQSKSNRKSHEDDDESSDLFGDEEEDKDEFDELDTNQESKTFIQKQSKENSDILDIDFSFLRDNKNLIKKNMYKKMSIEEIKKSAKNFIANLKNNLSNAKNTEEGLLNTSNNPENNDNSDDKNITYTQEDNNSIKNLSKASANIVEKLSKNLSNLDDEFYEIKHNIIMNLMK